VACHFPLDTDSPTPGTGAGLGPQF
jgi:hypothetical protein